MEAVKTVLSGLIGVRRKADHEKAPLNPVHVIVIAVLSVILFIATILTIVRVVTS
jgi:hypothetical protein